MSIAILIVPMLLDLAVLTSTLAQENNASEIVMNSDSSHLSKADAERMQQEIEALRRAGYKVRTGTSADTHGSAISLRTENGYDLGIRRNAKGAYDVVSHWTSSPDRAQIRNLRTGIEAQIRQKYAYEKVKRELARKGFSIASEEVQPDNTIKVVARRW
jgi:hypothetical protein